VYDTIDTMCWLDRIIAAVNLSPAGVWDRWCFRSPG
jgi:hypothetical protein